MDQAQGIGTDVVVGAASGMGRAIARRLSSTSTRLVLADVDESTLADVAAEVGGSVEVARCDLSEPADLVQLADLVGPLGRIVVTAGLSPTMAAGRRIYEVDIVGPARLIATFETLAVQGSVCLLFASTAGHLAPEEPAIDAVLDEPMSDGFFEGLSDCGIDVDEPHLAYMLSKRGVMRLVRRSAVSWGQRGARILSLSPGIVDTPMGRQEHAAQPMMTEMVEASPLGRAIGADEVAVVAEFLVSAAASAMTGVDVLVDGGSIAQMTG